MINVMCFLHQKKKSLSRTNFDRSFVCFTKIIYYKIKNLVHFIYNFWINEKYGIAFIEYK